MRQIDHLGRKRAVAARVVVSAISSKLGAAAGATLALVRSRAHAQAAVITEPIPSRIGLMKRPAESKTEYRPLNAMEIQRRCCASWAMAEGFMSSPGP